MVFFVVLVLVLVVLVLVLVLVVVVVVLLFIHTAQVNLLTYCFYLTERN